MYTVPRLKEINKISEKENILQCSPDDKMFPISTNK